MEALAVQIPTAPLAEFCQRWQIERLELFGSVLRSDFGPKSDIDVLVSFEENAEPGLFDLVTMQEELAALFGRPVDLIERKAVEVSPNWIRREAILASTHTIYPTS